MHCLHLVALAHKVQAAPSYAVIPLAGSVLLARLDVHVSRGAGSGPRVR